MVVPGLSFSGRPFWCGICLPSSLSTGKCERIWVSLSPVGPRLPPARVPGARTTPHTQQEANEKRNISKSIFKAWQKAALLLY